MVRANMIIGSLMVVAGLVLAIVGYMFMSEVNAQLESGFPDDFDDHYTYGGYIKKLDTSTGAIVTTNFTVDRHIYVDQVLDSDRLFVKEDIKARVNGTSPPVFIPDLEKHHNYTVDKKELLLYRVQSSQGHDQSYTGTDDVHWIFPHPVEKDDIKIWNMNILDWSNGTFVKEEKRGGVECYLFRGEEVMYEVPLTPAQAAALPPGTIMKLSLWEMAWVHPLTGTIVDYAKEIEQFLYFPELQEVPTIQYPEDMESTTNFTGTVTLFDQGMYTFVEMDNISVVRNLMNVMVGDDYRVNETVDVFDPLGFKIDLLSSETQVQIDPVTGAHTGLGRTGNYLFPPTGVGMMNYTFWDDGFETEVTAVYTGMDEETYGDHVAYIYTVDVPVHPYKPGGTATLEMTYFVEPMTGIVLDVTKHLVNWREQDARRLPSDTSQINKTVHLDTKLTTINPMTQQTDVIDLVAVQQINCSGYTNMSYQTAKIIEVSWVELPDGTVFSPPVTRMFGVDAKTMAYVHVDGWSNVDRTGVFTFPVGLLNESGEVTEAFWMYNSDLNTSLPMVLESQVDYMGRAAAVYRMTLAEYNLTTEQAEAALKMPLPVPGSHVTYSCDIEYTVDIDTGQILNVSRSIVNKLYPPTYEQMYQSLNTTLMFHGMMGDDNITMTIHATSVYLAEGMAMITVETEVMFDNGTPFLPPSMSAFPLEIATHKVLNETLGWTGLYWNFPQDPMSGGPYPMGLPFGPGMLLGAAAMTSYTDTAVRYQWTNSTIMDAGIFIPYYQGMNLSVTVNTTQRWLVDRTTGAVLDTNITMDIYIDTDLPPEYVIHLQVDEGSQAYLAQANFVTGWAIEGTGIPVMSVDSVLRPDESAMAVGKSMMLSKALLVADGARPALDLDIEFDDATIAQQMATVAQTKEKLVLLEKLKGAHMVDALLKSQDPPNRVAYVFYAQVPEDIDDNKGSIAYWGDFAKEKEDKANLYGTKVPLLLYAIAVILVIGAISFFLMKPKGEPEKEE